MSNIAQNQNITYTQKVIESHKSLLPKSLKVIEKSLISHYFESRYQQIVGESAVLLSKRHLGIANESSVWNVF